MASALLQLKNGHKAFGPKTLFESATFSINEGEHVGVIGPNGAGKTTLFKVLVQELELDDGELIFSNQVRVGYLTQHEDFNSETTVEEYLEKDTILPIWEVKTLAVGLGVVPELFTKPILSLSGGYRMRCKLLKLLGQEPNLLLLDEPTNYLDLETLLVLENFLQSYKGAFLLISHDREFLKRTTDHTLEVEGGDIVKYSGNIDDYFEQKEMLRQQLEAQALSQEQKKKSILDFVARFGAKATKASQAQSRLKQLDKMETIDIKALPVRAQIRIPEPVRTGKIVYSLENADLGYPERKILDRVHLKIVSGDHLAIIGLNGAGKSTLLKSIANVIPLLGGTRELGYQVTLGYYAQHVSEGLNPGHTVFESLSETAHPSLRPQEILDLAGSLLFSGSDVHKKISVLSGGERSRVALGRILLLKATCLVLDEPTNHLDFETVEALTLALQKYAGSIVVVSHDRSFVQRVAKKILEVKSGTVSLYPGTYEEYVWRLQKDEIEKLKTGRPSNQRVTAKPQSENPVHSGFNYKEAKKDLERKIRAAEKSAQDLEKVIEKAQAEMAAINAAFIEDPTLITRIKMERLKELQVEIDHAEEKWLALGVVKEALTREMTEKFN